MKLRKIALYAVFETESRFLGNFADAAQAMDRVRVMEFEEDTWPEGADACIRDARGQWFVLNTECWVPFSR